MLSKKEVGAIFIAILVLSFAINPAQSFQNFLLAFISIFFVVAINITAKKITGFKLDSEVEIKSWEIKRFGFTPKTKLKKWFPIGVFLPILSKIFLWPFKNFTWMASLVFDVKAKTYRAAKRHGLYSFSEMTEDHIGYIAAAGIAANIIFSLIGYLIGFPLFSKLNIYYAFFNLIPISNLDGNKIFFGNSILWSFLATLTLLGMVYAITI